MARTYIEYFITFVVVIVSIVLPFTDISLTDLELFFTYWPFYTLATAWIWYIMWFRLKR